MLLKHGKAVMLVFYSNKAAQHSVHLTSGSRRVFKQFAWLKVDSGKTALSRPAHQQVTQTVRRLSHKRVNV